MQKCKGKDCSVFRFTKSLAGLLALHCFAHLYHIRAYKERTTQPARTKMNTFKQPWAPAAIPQEKQPVEAGIVRTDTQGTSQELAPQALLAGGSPTGQLGGGLGCTPRSQQEKQGGMPRGTREHPSSDRVLKQLHSSPAEGASVPCS